MLNNENQLDEIIPESELLNQPTAKQSDFQVTPEQEEEILTKIKNYMELANKNYDNQEASIIKRYEKYYATEDHYATVFPKLSKVSQYCSSDISDVIEWALPSLIKAFLGTDDICEIKGMTPEDDDNAEVMKELVNWQLTKKNQAMIIFYNWFKDALITAFGIIKVQWQREEANIEKEEFVNSQTLMSYLQSGMNIVGAEQKGNDLYNLTYLQNAVTKNQPIIENLKFSEFRFIDGYKRITDCPFVAHVKKITKSDLKYKEKLGVYSNVDMATEKSNSNYTSKALDNIFKANKSDTPHMFTEKSMEEFELWECFVKIDIDNDGIAEDWIITIVNEVFLRAERNTYGRQPFFILSPWQDPHSLMPESSFSDKLAPIQDLKTALIKQAMYAIAQSNDPKTYINEQDININDLILNKQFIRTRGNKNMRDVVYHAPQVPLNNNTFPMIEFLSGERENRTGITRYNQGLDANSLNKMLALDTPIPMIDGSYKLNKDIVIGDKLIGSDGNVVTVTMAHPIQNPERAFEITFANGEVIKSGGEHRWSVKVCDKYYRNKSEEFEKLPTDRIFDLVNSGYKVYIPQSNYVNFTTKELPINPYVFGAYLGDGHSYSNRFTSMDKEVIDAFSNWAEENGGYLKESSHQNSRQAKTYDIINTSFRELLKDLNCVKDNRYEDMLENRKHIPEIYLTGDFEQRLSLLRGLMDTDGCITSKGTCIFSNSNKELIYNFEKLVISLGGYTNIQWQQPKKGKLAGRVYFSIAHCPVTIGYKVDRWKKRKDTDKLKITSIKEIVIEPMRCLTIDAQDELYCCGNKFTLTSNTATGISAIMSASNQRLELIVRIFAETGMKDLLLFLIQLNQKFYNQEQVIRLTNKELVIRPEDIRGQFDLTVSSGAGMATKEANAMNLQTMINTMMQLRNAGLSIITEQNIYETIKKYIENMGYKNTSTFVTEPSEIQKYQMLEQMAIQELFTMLPPQAQQKIMMMLEQSQGEMTQDILNILMMVAPSLPPEGQQLIQILFGGMINNGNVPLGISGAVQQSGQSYGSNAINQGSFRGNEGADNKSFMPHDRY